MSMCMKRGDLLFVYGTLRRGGAMDLSETRDGAEYLKEDHINGELFSLGSFPGAKVTPGRFDPGAPTIIGDVFRLLTDNIVTYLDHYEGYPNLYDRVQTETASDLNVWVYVYNHEVMESRRITNGNWLAVEPIIRQRMS